MKDFADIYFPCLFIIMAFCVWVMHDNLVEKPKFYYIAPLFAYFGFGLNPKGKKFFIAFWVTILIFVLSIVILDFFESGVWFPEVKPR